MTWWQYMAFFCAVLVALWLMLSLRRDKQVAKRRASFKRLQAFSTGMYGPRVIMTWRCSSCGYVFDEEIPCRDVFFHGDCPKCGRGTEERVAVKIKDGPMVVIDERHEVPRQIQGVS